MDRFHAPDYLLSTSRFISERCFAPAFRLPLERCLEFGYPRTDHLFEESSTTDARARLGIGDDGRQILGYFPTWRDDGFDFLGGTGFSFDQLNDALVEGNRLLLFKAHPNFGNLAPKNRSWSNIRVLAGSEDLYQVLPACDVLITDYSSVAFDFLVLDRPIVYFVPDHDRYVQHRNVYFSFDEMAVGPVVTTSEALYEVARAAAPLQVDRQRHDAVTELVWNGYRGSAIGDISEFIRSGSRRSSVVDPTRLVDHIGAR
jgi:CDP-glycerol glycerophosphotransferase (TagB/SpsB family)